MKDRRRTVAITGASSGIGAATARLLAARGDNVVLGARRIERLDALASEIAADGGRAVVEQVDVTRQDDLHRLVHRAIREFGRLDVLVSNAGVARAAPVRALDADGWAAMIDVNLRGVLHGIAAALPIFERQGRGHFVTVVSTAGLKVAADQAVYAATKNAVRTLLEGLRQESTTGALRTSAISPGFVRTELVDAMEDPSTRRAMQQRMVEIGLAPEAVARAIAFVTEQPDDVEIGELNIRPAVQA